MTAAGVTAFVELGPGDVLTRLLRRIAPEAAAAHVGAPGDLPAALALCRN
jgi:[acyl-carrier-protein] S-malonyltransferase